MTRARPWTPKRLKLLRKRLKLTQKELGERLGVHVVTVTRWETNVTVPSGLAAEKLNQLYAESRKS
jgi:DNA-binding transcriptional regulator YiaG